MNEENNIGGQIDISDYSALNSNVFTSNGLWSQISSSNSQPYDPFDGLEKRIEELEMQSKQQAIVIKIMRLKILALEGKFTQEEVTNIRKMIMSEDESSRTLADSIIENA